MILGGTPEDWTALWGAIEDEMAESTEKGLTVIFSVQEVETVCAVKMLQVRLPAACPGGCGALRQSAAERSMLPCERQLTKRHLGQLGSVMHPALLLTGQLPGLR